jgi:hypothetical protein
MTDQQGQEDARSEIAEQLVAEIDFLMQFEKSRLEAHDQLLRSRTDVPAEVRPASLLIDLQCQEWYALATQHSLIRPTSPLHDIFGQAEPIGGDVGASTASPPRKPSTKGGEARSLEQWLEVLAILRAQIKPQQSSTGRGPTAARRRAQSPRERLPSRSSRRDNAATTYASMPDDADAM